MNLYRQLVQKYAQFAREGREYPLGGFPDCPRPEIDADAPSVLIFSPHPDDEVIIGGLALRLMRQAKWRVINVAVTVGSNQARQAPRLEELQHCCRCIGFDLVQTAPNGLERISPQTREKDTAHWNSCVQVIGDLLKEHQPRVILFPHELDWNSTHIGTHMLVLDALQRLGPDFACHTVETEFWGQMPRPNLMVEISPEDLADLITALTFHIGEVQRNPYHLSLPAWMIDNVRRGGELVGGQGASVPAFAFATLYRLRRWQGGRFEDVPGQGRFLAADADPAGLFA
jgi:N-acetylglucosamine malate deacetylase 1